MNEYPIQTKVALLFAVLIVAGASAIVPIAQNHWPEQTWFLAVFQSSVFLLEGLTAVLLTSQVVATGQSRSFLWLAGGYAYTSLIAIIQLFTFPGLVSQTGGLGAGPQTAVWLWAFWHTGFPTFVIVTLRAVIWDNNADPLQRTRVSFLELWPLWIGIGAALAIGLLCTRYSNVLPPLIQAGAYNRLRSGGLGPAILALNLAALGLVIFVTRLRKPIFLWLAVGLLAFSLDVFLTLMASARYSAGWYAARGLSLVAASTLMIALIIRTFTLYRDAEARAALYGEEARRDGLTGLFNRRYFVDRMAQELKRAQRSGNSLTLLMLDIDYFKRINDTHGHLAGDACLRVLAKTLTERVRRAGDFVARYGGEEFAVVLPNTDAAGARELAEDIRRQMAALADKRQTPYPVTVSIGVATSSPGGEDSVESLIETADRFLYRAKDEGRNRVVAA